MKVSRKVGLAAEGMATDGPLPVYAAYTDKAPDIKVAGSDAAESGANVG